MLLLLAIPSALACSCIDEPTLTLTLPGEGDVVPTNPQVLLFVNDGWRPSDGGEPLVVPPDVVGMQGPGGTVSTSEVAVERANGGWVVRAQLAGELEADADYTMRVARMRTASGGETGERNVSIRTGPGPDTEPPAAPILRAAERWPIPGSDSCERRGHRLDLDLDGDVVALIAGSGDGHFLHGTEAAWTDHTCASNLALGAVRVRGVDAAGNLGPWSEEGAFVEVEPPGTDSDTDDFGGPVRPGCGCQVLSTSPLAPGVLVLLGALGLRRRR